MDHRKQPQPKDPTKPSYRNTRSKFYCRPPSMHE